MAKKITPLLLVSAFIFVPPAIAETALPAGQPYHKIVLAPQAPPEKIVIDDTFCEQSAHVERERAKIRLLRLAAKSLFPGVDGPELKWDAHAVTGQYRDLLGRWLDGRSGQHDLDAMLMRAREEILTPVLQTTPVAATLDALPGESRTLILHDCYIKRDLETMRAEVARAADELLKAYDNMIKAGPK